MNDKLGLTGTNRWEVPSPPTDAAVGALYPTNQPGGYSLPEAVDPNAGNTAIPAHKVAARYERVLAYQVHKGGGQFGASQIVVWWGATIGSNGSADAISVDPTTGQVTLWDSKAYASGSGEIESKTLSEVSRREAAVTHAKNIITTFAWKPEDLVAGGLRDKALASLNERTRNYKMLTVRYKAVSNNFQPLHLKQTATPAPTGE